MLLTFCGDIDGHYAEEEAGNVGGHVRRVGLNRDRVGQDATHYLADHEQRAEHEHTDELAPHYLMLPLVQQIVRRLRHMTVIARY